MAAPLARRELTIEIDGPLASRPYVAMTLDVMRSLECKSKRTLNRKFYNFHAGRYEAREYAIEPDASAASYFALPAILGAG